MKGTLGLASLIAFVWIWLIPGPVRAGSGLPGELSNVPVFFGSKILRTIDKPGQCSAILEVNSDRDTVAAFYKKTLEENGWKRAVESQYGSGGVLQFTKGDDILQIAIVNRKKDDIVTLLYNIVYMHKKK